MCSSDLLAVALVGSFSLHAHPAADAMADGAKKFLAALKPEQKAKAHYADMKVEARTAWHFIPTEMVSFGRKGLPFTEMTEAQRKLALALLQSALSEGGYTKATSIMKDNNKDFLTESAMGSLTGMFQGEEGINSRNHKERQKGGKQHSTDNPNTH